MPWDEYNEGEHVWSTYSGGKYDRYCGKCDQPMSLETMTRRCQAGGQRWGQQPPPPVYGHRQATMKGA